MTIEEEIRAIQEEMDKTQKNKATEHHMGRLKAKMARLKDDLIKKAISSKGGSRGLQRQEERRRYRDARGVSVGGQIYSY